MKKISAYTTSRNTVSLNYPLKECLTSLLQFADEIIVCDTTDKEDGTRDILNDFEKNHKQIKVYHLDLDYSTPNHGILDGWCKGFSRSKTLGAWLFSADLDEFISAEDAKKIPQLINQLEAQNVSAISLPVIEFWDSLNKIRIDINPWKERISKNNPNITHGIPIQLRQYHDGLLYAKPGTDGCNLIYKDSGELVPIAGFMTEEIDKLRRIAVTDMRYVSHYENWFNEVIDQLPSIYHFSWISIERKIRMYREYWDLHWKSLYNQVNKDNPFFDVPWNEVTDEMIKAKAKELGEKTSGWVFHSKWNGSKTNGITINKSLPEVIVNSEWLKTNLTE